MSSNDHSSCDIYVKTTRNKVSWGSGKPRAIKTVLLVALTFLLLMLFGLRGPATVQAEANPDPGPKTFYAMFFNDDDRSGTLNGSETMAAGISASFSYTNALGVGIGFNAFSRDDGYITVEMFDCPCEWKMNAEGRRWTGDVVQGEGDTFVPVPVWRTLYYLYLSLIKS